ncbi:DUF116 domain-containing protein [Syntrophobacter fumaroxidans]|uniref:DUF116 domain-containing protein n=1 Tax=Syntrophobacter fumaroxidans (strain DSM 10017 / MPOB) TaxID=335543 RepID=A0LEJ9_SYNFM|nr:DUF116 domain-containing protein [Syntrophobacter fumaroxidans]ABK15851.1 protein of unknown function DUF116 [Syntrophobacter fumaroxidans MPOB]
MTQRLTSFKMPPGQPEKKTILILVALTAVLLTILLVLFYIVPYYGFSRIHAGLPIVMGVLVAAVGGFVVLSLVLLMVVFIVGHDVPFSKKLRSIAVKGLLPTLTVVGKLIGLRKEEVQHAFVAVNNELVMAQCRNGHPPRNVLLLMPHCLQNADCPVKITYRVENCKRCGKCRIKDLLDLSEKYGVSLAVATGGTIARRIVIEKRPDLIIAVACERDLTSGIQDTTPLPVYGIFNQRPFGPCLNTQVAMDQVESILKEVMEINREKS